MEAAKRKITIRYVLQIFCMGRWTEWPAGEDLGEALKAFHRNKMNSTGCELVQYFGEDREGPDKTWPAKNDWAFMIAGQQLAGHLPMGLVVALAEAMLNERRVESERILEIAALFLG